MEDERIKRIRHFVGTWEDFLTYWKDKENKTFLKFKERDL